MTDKERREILADEWLMVRHSGEIPEITLHSSFYYLTEDADGPGLILSEEESSSLKEAALARYHEIILRDICVENYHKTIYRGVRRTLYNWQRCQAFATRQSMECDELRETAAQALLLFLQQGSHTAENNLPEKFINCSMKELEELTVELGLKREQLPANIAQFCLTVEIAGKI